jgi:hypothetical protein
MEKLVWFLNSHDGLYCIRVLYLVYKIANLGYMGIVENTSIEEHVSQV